MRLLALPLLMKHCRRTLAWTVKSLEDACCMQWLEKLLEEWQAARPRLRVDLRLSKNKETCSKSSSNTLVMRYTSTLTQQQVKTKLFRKKKKEALPHPFFRSDCCQAWTEQSRVALFSRWWLCCRSSSARWSRGKWSKKKKTTNAHFSFQAISDVKKFLEQHGVVAEALAGPAGQPSDEAFLVKNLPIGTTSEQLEQLWESKFLFCVCFRV